MFIKKIYFSRKVALTFLVFFLPFSMHSQTKTETWIHTTYLKMTEIEQGNSYITFPWDIGNIEDLITETNINPSFVVRENDRAHLMMVLTPQIILRLFNSYSSPVKTPSYMPHLTLYYSIGDSSSRKMHSIFLRFEHHSNDQQASTYLPTGELNLDSGDFSTNYFEPGIIRAFYYKPIKKVLFFESSFEIHMKNHTQPEILGKYAMYKWNNRFSIVSPPEFFHKKGDYQVDVNLDWSFGEINHWSPCYYKRLTLDLTFFYRPKFFSEIGLFVRYYLGMDYYNIHFDHHLSVIRFGLMTPFLRF